MINKVVRDMAEAMAGIENGSTVLVGGFGSVGQPDALIDGLIEHGAKELTVVANNAGAGRIGLARLLELRRVRKIICSYPRSAGSVVFEELFRNHDIELELVPQGTLAERIRAGGRRHPGLLHADLLWHRPREGQAGRGIRRAALCAGALAEGGCGAGEGRDWRQPRQPDLPGSAARNFNALMCMAAAETVVQVSRIVPALAASIRKPSSPRHLRAEGGRGRRRAAGRRPEPRQCRLSGRH
jgi:3-oxoadipate CoA-transferase alpha subunit